MSSDKIRRRIGSFDFIVYDPINKVIVCHRTCDDNNPATHPRIEKNTTKLDKIIPFSVREQCKIYIITHSGQRDVLAGPLFAVEAFLRTGDALLCSPMPDKHDADFLLEIAYALFAPICNNFSLFKRPAYRPFFLTLS